MSPEESSEPAESESVDSETTNLSPSVVAVVATCNPGEWFAEFLQSLRDQDYQAFATLVVDAGSTEDPLPTIAAVLPNAYVRRLDTNPGYSAAANRALQTVQGATHLLFCHDDVILPPDAVSSMLDVAVRTNAGIVIPKLVEWDNPELLDAMGGSVDSTGVFIPLIDRGDLDQGQHDVSAEVFIASGGAMLVRVDLFTSLNGFDPEITLFGEDIDLSWRAQIASARIVTAPSVRVRHMAACDRGLRSLQLAESEEEDYDSAAVTFDSEVLRRRHHLRTVLKVKRRLRLPFTIIKLLAFNIVEVVYSLIVGRSHQAGAVVAAWTWNISRCRQLMRLRKDLRKVRHASDKELSKKYASTRSRLGGVLRTEWQKRSERMAREVYGRELVGTLRNLPLAVWATVLVILLIGSRNLLTGPLPGVGQLIPWAYGPIDSLKAYMGMFPGEGFGTASSASPAYLMAGLSGILFFGAMGTLQKVLVLGMIPLGIYGMYRVTRRLKSPRARLVAVIAYAAIPLPYDSIAFGRWDGLIAFAVAPFILSRLLRVHASVPYAAKQGYLRLSFRRHKTSRETELETMVVSDISSETAAKLLNDRNVSDVEITRTESPEHQTLRGRIWFLLARRVLPLALLLSVVGVFAPQLLGATLVVAAAFVLGSILSGEPGADRLRSIGVATAAVAVALVLISPALIGSDFGWKSLWSHPISPEDPNSLMSFALFHTGGFTNQILTMGLFLAAVPAILIGREWRFHLSARLWLATISIVGIAWLGADERLGSVLPDPHTFSALGAACLALNAAVGIVSLHEDLPRYRFGWRQVLPIVAIAGVVIAIFPIATRAGNGSWNLPESGASALLSWTPPNNESSYRTLWLGDANGMPGGARDFAETLSASVATKDVIPSGLVSPSPGGDGETLMANAIEQAQSGSTVQLGRLLSPFGVKYLVIPNRTGTADSTGKSLSVPVALVNSLEQQIDLSEVQSDGSMLVYENTEWAPIRQVLNAPAVVASHNGDQYAAQDVSMTGASSVLNNVNNPAQYSGNLTPGELYVAQEHSDSWRVAVAGKDKPSQVGFNWASTYRVDGPGNAKLLYVPPTWVIALQVFVLLAWITLFFVAARNRARRGRFS